MSFSLGDLDVEDIFGIGNFLVCGDGVSGDKEYGVVHVNAVGWET